MAHCSDEELITFDRLCDIYIEAGSFASPSELHGELCGQLCAQNRLKASTVISIASTQMGSELVMSESAKKTILVLYQQILKQLSAADFHFYMLLPDDSDPLSMRLECLSQWCHGFVTGYGSGKANNKSLSKQAKSILIDLMNIIKIDTDVDDQTDNPDEEQSYEELCDYVQMAVLVLFDENFSVQQKSQKQENIRKNKTMLH
ncbi:MAG: UPF0149 family protein [Endozoicomonadaceae bacterium]|nr:UPF0149 family protein [Endozoicomonadaceae bacterium]